MTTVSEYNDKRRKEILLGQAKNQASNSLEIKDFAFIEDYETNYKKLVKHFYKWNTELDEEILKGGQ